MEEDTARIAAPDQSGNSLLFLGWTTENLRAAMPSFDPARASSMQLISRNTACEPGAVSVDGSRVQLPMPKDTARLRFEEGRGWAPMPADDTLIASLGQFSLDLPTDSAQCFGDSAPSFVPFGGMEPLIGPNATIAGRSPRPGETRFRDVVRLEDDRVVAISSTAVFVVERGRTFDDRPGQAISLLESEGLLVLRALAVDPEPSRGEGRMRVFVIASPAMEDTVDGFSLLFELRLGELGLEQVGTATRTVQTLGTVVVRPEDGRLVVGASPAQIFTMLPGGPLENVQLPLSGTKRVEVNLTGIAATPYAIVGTAAGVLLLGDETARVWEPDRNLRGGSAFRAVAARPTSTGFQLWVGDSDGNLFEKQANGSWIQKTPKLDPSHGSCFLQDAICGWFGPITSARALVFLDAYEPERLLMFLDGCAAVIVMTTDARCSVLTPLGSRPIESAPSEVSFSIVHASPRWVTLAAKDGSLYEMPRRPN